MPKFVRHTEDCILYKMVCGRIMKKDRVPAQTNDHVWKECSGFGNMWV